MKKAAKLALIAVPLVLAYSASAWLVGMQVESAISEQYQLLAENPSAKIVERNYQRGIFGATELVTVELLPEMMQSIARKQQEIAAQNPGMKLPPPPSFRIKMRSDIRHGPLPGFSKFAAAVVDSELVLEGEAQQMVSTLFAGQKPLQVHTEYRFDGGGVSTLTSPGFSTNWAADKGVGRNTLVWDGIRLTVDFQKGMKRYTMQAEAPKLELKESQGGAVTLTGLRLSGEQQRVFDDEPLLYGGSQKLTVDQLNATTGKEGSDALMVKQLVYDVAIPVNGEFIDVLVKTGAESLQVGQQNYGPAHYDVSFRHLHARTAATLYRTLMKAYSDPAVLATAAAEPTALYAPLAKPALELLRHNPEFSIDRISFRSPHGEAMVAARVKLVDMKEQDFANPLMLLAKLDAGGEISLPEGFVGELATSGVAEEELAARNETLRQQLATYTEQGLILREGTQIKSKLAFAKGQMTVNGKPFNPMAMVPGKAPEAAK